MLNNFKDRLRIAYLVVALSTASLAQADQATVGFMLLFGDDVRAVEATEQTEDDARLAERLFQEAESGQHADALTMLLYEKTYEYGMKDLTGYPTADQALGRMLEKDDARSREIGDMRLALLEKWIATERDENQQGLNVLNPDELIDLYLDQSRLAAEARDIEQAIKYLRRCNEFTSKTRSPRRNEIKEAIGELYQLRKLLKDIAELEEQLDADPAAAGKLAMIHLTEFDDPAKAATYADRMSDKQLAAKIRLAAMDFELATADNAKDTGAFYLGLVNDGQARQPVPMLIRAKAWLTEYLSRRQGGDQEIKAVNDMLAQVDQGLLRQGVGQKLARIMAGRVRGDGQFERPADIQAAIDRGVAWLYTMRDPERQWEQDAETHRNWGGYTALAVYALLMADEDPQANRDLNRATNFMMNADLKGTYALCFRIHAWEVLPQRERFRRVLQRDVLALRGGLTRHGFWGYTMTGKDVVPGKKLDLSTTLAGGLGIWIGEEVGGISPKASDWERIARGIIRHQREDSGWAYNAAASEVSHGSMTAGALALLHAGYPHLSDETKTKVDESIAGGMKWMDENFSPTTNVNRGNFTNYYFAAVQHAGIFAARRDFREMDWYESIAKHLLQSQFGDGSWGSVQETAFAIAFLCRGGIVYEPSIGDQPEPVAGDDAPAEQPAE